MSHQLTGNKTYRFLVASGKLPFITSMLNSIVDHCHPTESASFVQWAGDKFYIEVIDQTMLAKAREMEPDSKRRDCSIAATRFLVSIDIRTDSILLNSQGGNCMVRGVRWRRFAENTQLLTKEIAVNKDIRIYK